ncbi:MAG: nuclear transport factor 2 family protein [Hyphomonadaceae bacterium]|nr:nuclear transport factor 2 family protein [Hyphomonadaceae bacterium]
METVREWLQAWERAIRTRDFDAGRALFDEAASGFGTVTERTHNLEDLVKRQWMVVWPRTSDFSFDPTDIDIRISKCGGMAIAHARWMSRGVDAGGERPRAGRCTVALLRDAVDSPWRCIHTHFSMWPASGDVQLLTCD